jgi:hypothetical protein
MIRAPQPSDFDRDDIRAVGLAYRKAYVANNRSDPAAHMAAQAALRERHPDWDEATIRRRTSQMIFAAQQLAPPGWLFGVEASRTDR